jgi:hypothetical protein
VLPVDVLLLLLLRLSVAAAAVDLLADASALLCQLL